MNEIVKYHNHMNTVNFYGFNSIELDLLLSICAKIRDEGIKTVTYTFDELRTLSQYTATATKNFVKDLKSTYKKLIHLTFCIGNEEDFTEFVLFTEYTVLTSKQEVIISVNEKFKHILNELTANFTRFELHEFTSLQSKYAKNLYRLLKQYRSTGKVYFSINDFREKLDIPKSYQMRDINKTILVPITEELTPLFQDFRIEKVKNTSKRGQPVTHINFFFTPEKRIDNQENNLLEQIRQVYLPDFTLDEVKLLKHYGSDEDLKFVSKKYNTSSSDCKIENKMGFMITLLKKHANNSQKKNNHFEKETADLLENFLFDND